MANFVPSTHADLAGAAGALAAIKRMQTSAKAPAAESAPAEEESTEEAGIGWPWIVGGLVVVLGGVGTVAYLATRK